jgi:hypothetical protein
LDGGSIFRGCRFWLEHGLADFRGENLGLGGIRGSFRTQR